MIIIVPLVIIVGVIGWLLRPRIGITRPRKLSIIAVIPPSLAVGIAAAVLQLIYNANGDYGVAELSNALFIVLFGLVCAAILAAIGFIILRKWEVVKGIGFGICISVVISVIVLALLEWLGEV